MPKVIEMPIPTADVATAERRRFRRYGVNLPCLVKVCGGRKSSTNSLFVAETINASRGGFFFLTKASAAWEVGKQIECVMELPARTSDPRFVAIRCWGRVVRVVFGGDGRAGVGVVAQHFCLPAALQDNVLQTRGPRLRAHASVIKMGR